MENSRQEEFDVLRALTIISAIILHYNDRLDLGIFAFPSRFVQAEIFNVGSFFFFTAGYMAHQIYLVRFENNSTKTTSKIFRKGLEILFLYIVYITFMRLSTGASIPTDPYNFIYSHGFYTKVLFTFSIIYMISPIVIALYSKSRQLFLTLISLILAIYCFFLYAPLPETVINSEIIGVFLGIGKSKITYPILPALITYCIGFLLVLFDKKYISRSHHSRRLFWISISILVLHSLLTISFNTYRFAMNLQPVNVLATSIFVFLCLILTRYSLMFRAINILLTKKAFILIGVKTLTFYVVSNLVLGLLSFSKESVIGYKLIVFLSLFSVTYLATAWNFYSDRYFKLLRDG
jgi:hypothetical protein